MTAGKAYPICLVCERRDVDRCHIRSRGAGGSDEPRNIMYLCREHHTEQHQIGMITFNDKYPDVPRALVRKGWSLQRINGKRVLWHPEETGTPIKTKGAV